MSLHSRMHEDLVVIAPWEGLVPKEVDLVVFIVAYMTQTIGFIPALGKDIEGDLTPDGVLQIQVREPVL